MELPTVEPKEEHKCILKGEECPFCGTYKGIHYCGLLYSDKNAIRQMSACPRDKKENKRTRFFGRY